MRHVPEELLGHQGKRPVRGVRDRRGRAHPVRRFLKRESRRPTGRPQKLGDQIQRELSELVAREVRDPRVGMLTITSVDVSPDLSHAKIFFTLLQKDKLPETLQGLKRSSGFLRSQLAKRIKLYTTPELRFVYDESVERGDHLSRLIESTKSRP